MRTWLNFPKIRLYDKVNYKTICSGRNNLKTYLRMKEILENKNYRKLTIVFQGKGKNAWISTGFTIALDTILTSIKELKKLEGFSEGFSKEKSSLEED